MADQQLNDKSYYKRFILFRPSVAQGQAYRRPTPPGFWSRLLSRIISTVKEIRSILSKQVPVEEEDLVISSNLSYLPSSNYTTSLFNSDSEDQLCPVTETGLMFETCSVVFDDSNTLEGPLENDGVQLPTSSSPIDLTSETLSVNCSNFSDPDIDKSTVPSPMSSSPTTSESLLSTTNSTFSSKDPVNHNTETELMSEKPSSVYCNVFGEPKVDTSTMLSSKSVTPTSSESLLRTTTTTLHEYTVDPITENGLISETIECDLPTIPSPGPSLPTISESPLTYGTQCKQSQGGLLEVFPIKGEQSEDALDTVIENGLMSETSSMISGYSNTFGGPFEYDRSTTVPSLSLSPGILESSLILGSRHLSCEESQGESLEVFPIEGGGNLVHWRTGLFYNVNKLTFVIESLAELKRYQDKDGVLILASQGAEGRKILGQLIDIVEQLISEWYPGLNGELEQKVPCIECIKCGVPSPHEFKVDQLLPLIADHKLINKCGGGHEVRLVEIVPDLLLQDLDPAFLLDPREVIYKQEKESLLGTGAFANVYRGKYKGRAVAIKLYTAKENTKVEEQFKELRSESKVLQQLHHPSLVCMVGVTVHPSMLLVLEEAPEGSLQAPLLREQRLFPRIVLHRIAIQVASALCFLHSINIIFRDLKADNVLLWSLLPDHLINCKVTDFNIASHADPGGARGLHGTKGFIAPEVAHVNRAKERSVYDHRADIFSFGMFLYQLLARRHPFHNVQPFRIEAAIEEGQRPQLEDVSLGRDWLVLSESCHEILLGWKP